MSHVRILTRALVVLALVGTALALGASPVSAQDSNSNLAVQVVSFKNAEATDDNTAWQVRIRITSLGGCTPDQGVGREGYDSGWFNEGSWAGAALNVGMCFYDYTAQARKQAGEVCEAELAWGESGSAFKSSLNSADSNRQKQIAVRHKNTAENPGASDIPNCVAAISVTFNIDPKSVVKPLPAGAKDDNLEARARRAVEVTDFAVRVLPHESSKNTFGCNILLSFTMQGGDDGSVKKDFDGIPVGQECSFQAFIVNDPLPFAVDKAGTTFKTSKGSMTVELGGQVKMMPARISIVQDVVGAVPKVPKKRGVSYSIARSCAGVDALPPHIVPTGGAILYQLPGGDWRASLVQGRYTVHSDRAPNFGPGATYHAAARSTSSSVVQGCTVIATIEHVPQGCVVAGGETQARTWRSTRPFEHFDFEFDIACDGTGAQSPADLPPQTATDADGAGSTSPNVRIVARKLENGKIEFALEQRQADDSWGARLYPTARLLPTTARVGTWHGSTPLEVIVAAAASDFVAEIEVRIVARKRSSGSVEFALQRRNDDGKWGSRQLLPQRLFPPDTRVGRWLRSSVFTLNGG